MDFRILGPLEVHDGDRQLALGGTRQRALLALLLLHANEVVSRDRLIDELWGEDGIEDGSKALQVAISRLRRTLEPERSTGQVSDLLVTRPPGYELRLARGQLDLHRFEDEIAAGRASLEAGDATLAADRLAGALALWRGPPLADLGYESFSQTEIGRLQELRAGAVEDRIAAELQLGRHANLVAELQTLVREHPLRERLREQLMLALYRSGRQADALAAYRQARETLVEELGIEPGPDLKQLERAILAQDETLRAPAGKRSGPEAAAAASETLVGRKRELGELLSLLDRAVSGNGALALIGGEPGIGKSRLAEALAEQAQLRGAKVLVGRCWEAGGAPSYWPWVQVLRAYMRGSDRDDLRAHVNRAGAELATLVPEMRDLLAEPAATPAPESSGARFRLFESVASFLRIAASAEPLVLVFDDLHAADAPSLLLLRFVTTELTGARIVITGCFRDTEVGPDDLLAEALPELTRDAAVTRIALKGLSGPDTARLLELVTGEPPPHALSERVHAETAGNPLFSSEVARLLAAEGRLSEAGKPGASLPIPDGVRDAIAGRLARQSDRCRQLLVLASVLGREFDLDALQRVSGLEENDLFEALEEAVGARLVGEVPGTRGRLRFSHVLMRDTIYDDLAPTRRLRLHREIADALEELYSENLEPHLAELAHHYVEAGSAGSAKAIDYSERAGHRAAAQHGYEEAARHYSTAVRLLEAGGRADPEREGELLLSLGEVLSRAGEATEAKRALLRAAELAEASGDSQQLTRAALGYGGRFAWARASTDVALVPLLERALAAVGEDDSPGRVRLLARLAASRRDDPLRERRAPLAREALEMARRIGDPLALAYALEGHRVAVEGPDNIGSFESADDELLSLAARLGDKEREYTARDARLRSRWALADRAGVDVEIDALGRVAEDLRQPAQRWHNAMTHAELALMEGRFGHAEELISEAAALGQRAESWNAAVSNRVASFVLRRAQGRLAELEDTLMRSAREYPALLRFHCIVAHVHVELGRKADAQAALDELISRDLRTKHLDAEWLFSVNLLPEVCAALEDASSAARLYEIMIPYEGLWAEAPIEGVFGATARGLGTLATVLGRFEDAERHFRAAIELERRMRARPWLAHAQHGLGAMLLARAGPGDEDEARSLLGEASDTYRELGMGAWSDRATALLR